MDIVNAEQYGHWNSGADSWISNNDRIDGMLGVFDGAVLTAAKIAAGARVLDVGCGTGSTTVAAAVAAAPGGESLGVDLSAATLEEGRRRAQHADVCAMFEQGDAQVYPFEAGAYDAVISRFGLMFFDDPVAAFTNLARATRPGGRLAFVSWQPLMQQQWMLVMGAAVMQHVSMPAEMPGDGPGMFGLSDPQVITQVLTEGGWSGIDIVDHRARLLFGGGGPLQEALGFMEGGMLNMMLGDDADPEVRNRALASLRDALAPYESADGVGLEGAVWLVTANR